MVPGVPSSLLAPLLLVLAVISPVAVAGEVPDYRELARAVASTPFDAVRCQELAAEFGDWVLGQRDRDSGRSDLLDGRELGEKLHGACRNAIRELERATNEDEAALENLYRSERWYEVNRALASLRYWQAWLDLSLARGAPQPGGGITELSRAERGFQAASLRILYPGLVYGSWLGLAYVAQLRGDLPGMEQRLTLLRQALASDPGNPLLEIVDTELALLALRSDPAAPIATDADQPLSAASARLVEEQAFALLARQRAEGSGAIQAAQNLRRLIDQGFLDDRLLARLFAYRDEVTGHDIGPLGLLVDAEFAYAYQQYDTTVLKFRRFLASDAAGLPLDLRPFYYHYAVALYRIGLHREAIGVLQPLREDGGLPAVLQVPVAKLQFIVAEAIYQGDPAPENALVLRRAAGNYIATAADDPDVPAAHLAMARVVDDAALRRRHLEQAGADTRLADNVRAVQLELALSRFQQALAGADSAAAVAAATAAMELWQGLPRRQRQTPAMQVLLVQLNSVLAEDAAETLQLIDSLYADPALSPSQRRVLLWSRLRLLDRLQGVAALIDYLAGLPETATDPAVSHELYLLLREFESGGRNADVERLSEAWLPRLAADPQLQRQVWLMRIHALRKLGADTAALAAIQGMLATFPQSGDAWEQLAEQSQQMGDSFAAERAWAHIAGAEAEGSDRWLEVSLRRLALLAAGDAGDGGACSLARRLRVYHHRMDTPQSERFGRLSGGMDCTGEESG